MDLCKIQEIYEKVYRRNNFVFKKSGKSFSRHIMCVKFTYAYKLFNKAAKNTYVKDGWQLKDLEFKDCIALSSDNQVVGVVINTLVENPVSNDCLGESFIFENGTYVLAKDPETLLTKRELREDLYKNGFYCDGIKFVRYKRSSGSSRVGKCLFVDERLYNRLHKWDLCGLDIKNGDEIDLAGLESYISLPSSSIIDTIELEAKNFLIVDDYNSVFDDIVIGVDYVNGHLTSSEVRQKLSNSIFDGQSLMDKSVFGEYLDKGFLLLRNRFFKSACFNSNIQQFFKDNKITDISQLNGRTIADKIEDIKIITTPSSIKYLKFGNLNQWLDKLDTTFGVVKYEKPPHYFNGKMVQCHYQLINTLQLEENDVEEFVAPNLEYIAKVRNDPDILRYHIQYPFEEIDKCELTPLLSRNEIIFKMLGINNNFCKTKLYLDFRNDLIKSMMKNLKRGHVLVNGNYSVLLGNGYEMLLHSIGQFNGKSVLGIGNIYSKRFAYNQTILGSRSPHINSGNIYLAQNKQVDEIDLYFNLTENIVYVNSIGENLLQRLNGADFDADSLLLTDNSILINAAKKNYDWFKVPTCLVSAKKTIRHYTVDDLVDLDVKTSVNKIGEIVNLSQYLNSIMWNNINNGQCLDDVKDLYLDICKLAVLSGIEIDRAKREYEINSGNEIKLLKDKWKQTKNNKFLKPMFFKMITTENGYKLNSNHIYKRFKTPMDHLQKCIDKFNFRQNRDFKTDIIPFYKTLKQKCLHGAGARYYQQRDRILNLISIAKSEMAHLYDGYDLMSHGEREYVKHESARIKQECIAYINDISLSENTMYLLLIAIEDEKYKNISRFIFNTLFGSPNEAFYKLLENSKEKILELKENDYGNIVIFDSNFIKI